MARIVIVEDEHDLREAIQEDLEDAGHVVFPAADGAAGIDAIIAEKPDLILADINMPVMNGFEMKARLHKIDPEAAAKPFIFVSAFADMSDIADGLMQGADHYITKPIDFDALHAWVRRFTT